MRGDNRKVVIVGCGFVGMSYAYAMVNQGVCDELVLIDIDAKRAAGEAMDKAARTVGLPYPGGVNLDKISVNGDENKYKFPVPKVADSKYDFSFSGLKTFAVNLVHNASQKGEEVKAEDLGASFIKAVTDLLASHTMEAVEDFGAEKLVLAGGVSANSRLRRVMEERCESKGIKLYKPELKYCGDNAAMIASQGYYEFLAGKRADLTLNAVASMPITEG